jgi:hypothetical protein
MARTPKDPRIQQVVEILSNLETEIPDEQIRRVCKLISSIDSIELIKSRIPALANRYYDRAINAYSKAIREKDLKSCDYLRNECDRRRQIVMAIIIAHSKSFSKAEHSYHS